MIFPVERKQVDNPKTILVSSLDMTKGLTLARAFYLAGHRVVGSHIGRMIADRLSPGYLSNAVDFYYRLPDPRAKGGREEYVEKLVEIIQKQKVDLWVCVSGVFTAVDDAYAKEIIEAHTNCKVFQFREDIVRGLDSKWSFIQSCEKFAMPVPETIFVRSQEEAMKFLETKIGMEGPKYIIKCIKVDDLSRGDMTQLPLSSAKRTKEWLKKLDISRDNPWVFQEYIAGKEYCTHAVVSKGKLTAFAAAESSDMLMHYRPLTASNAVQKAMLKFTETYVERIGEKIDGQVSFDFMLREDSREFGCRSDEHLSNAISDGRDEDDAYTSSGSISSSHETLIEFPEFPPDIYPIECNPRAHTAIVLFTENLADLANAYLASVGANDESQQICSNMERIVYPAQTRKPRGYYWVGHDLVSLGAIPILRLLALREEPMTVLSSLYELMAHLLTWKDAVWESWDPLVWWWMYFIFWPAVLLENLWRGGNWSRINVSTGRIFLSE